MSIFIESDSALAHMFNACTTEQINEFIPEKRSLRIHGQSTTLRLERAFWNVLDEIAQKAQAPPSLRTPRSSGSRPQVASLARASTLGPSERGSGGADASGVPKFGLTLS